MGMTLAEQFKCEIPSPDATKEGVLYCSTNATNMPEIWSASAAVVTAIATVLLVLGVRIAYRQIKLTREMNDDNQQLQAMGQYLTAVQYLQHTKISSKAELQTASDRIRSSGALFQLAFRLVDERLIYNLNRFDSELIKFAELEFYSQTSSIYKKNHPRYGSATAHLARAGAESVSRLRSRNFGIKDLESNLIQAVNAVRAKVPNSDMEWMVARQGG